MRVVYPRPMIAVFIEAVLQVRREVSSKLKFLLVDEERASSTMASKAASMLLTGEPDPMSSMPNLHLDPFKAPNKPRNMRPR